MKRVFFLIIPTVALAGCVVGPDYEGPPALPSAGAIQPKFASHPPGTHTDTPALEEWWLVLQDPVLNEIEKLALASAPDLAAAQARTAQARATLRSEKANRWPTAGVQATTIQGKLPGLDLQRETSPQTTAPPEDSSSLSFYNFGIS